MTIFRVFKLWLVLVDFETDSHKKHTSNERLTPAKRHLLNSNVLEPFKGASISVPNVIVPESKASEIDLDNQRLDNRRLDNRHW